jgi:hypothetical protein
MLFGRRPIRIEIVGIVPDSLDHLAPEHTGLDFY